MEIATLNGPQNRSGLLENVFETSSGNGWKEGKFCASLSAGFGYFGTCVCGQHHHGEEGEYKMVIDHAFLVEGSGKQQSSLVMETCVTLLDDPEVVGTSASWVAFEMENVFYQEEGISVCLWEEETLRIGWKDCLRVNGGEEEGENETACEAEEVPAAVHQYFFSMRNEVEKARTP